MKLITFILLLILSPNLSFGQADLNNRKSIFLEIAGSGGLGSINYESHFYKKGITEFTWRLGFSLAPIDKNNGTAIIFPVMINSLIGKKKHKLELGIGQGFTITTKGSPFALTVASIGYRYQAESKNWFYKIAYTPLISYLVDFQVQQWGGVSIGYTFNNTIK
ncbi:MAG: hypothetical protein COZ18_09460 [Flexibacter sp. CG_4_10_14_3_um_filter_32_15]|nr:MAG: hypothetical protein COZ18_09460 [Flexibacter sp. CG_4_10_14_3_um_filter_32_15]